MKQNLLRCNKKSPADPPAIVSLRLMAGRFRVILAGKEKNFLNISEFCIFVFNN